MLRNRKKNIKVVALGKKYNSDTIQAAKAAATSPEGVATLKMQWATLTPREQKKYIKHFGNPFSNIKNK